MKPCRSHSSEPKWASSRTPMIGVTGSIASSAVTARSAGAAGRF